jgi:hypothetical protein
MIIKHRRNSGTPAMNSSFRIGLRHKPTLLLQFAFAEDNSLPAGVFNSYKLCKNAFQHTEPAVSRINTDAERKLLHPGLLSLYLLYYGNILRLPSFRIRLAFQIFLLLAICTHKLFSTK